MTPYRLGLNLAQRGFRLPRLLRRHPLAVIPTIGLVLFMSVYFFADTRQKHENLLYGPPVESIVEKAPYDIRNIDKTNLTTLSKPSKEDDESIYFRLDQASRLTRVKDVCQASASLSNRSSVDSLITSKHNLTYCPIPRSAHTFWLQVFRFLNHDMPGGDPMTPFDLDPEEVHSRPFIKTNREFWKMLNEDRKERLLKTKIFMSVQDPYMRLWSTYVHALILPELWEAIGQKIEVRRSQPRPQPMAFFHLRHPVRCGHDVTFSEFIDYVLASYEKDFLPYHRLCDPCRLGPRYVIKAETAQRDNFFVLKDVKLAWTIAGKEFKSRSLAQYVTSLVSGSFKKMKNTMPKECDLTVADMAHRLWKAFVVEGIIPEGVEQPSLENIDQSQFVQLVLQNADSDADQPRTRLAQKRKYMSAAFRNLGSEKLKRVQEKYDMDFKLFDYDSQPPDIFV